MPLGLRVVSVSEGSSGFDERELTKPSAGSRFRRDTDGRFDADDDAMQPGLYLVGVARAGLGSAAGFTSAAAFWISSTAFASS
jgi:hypothetical protein